MILQAKHLFILYNFNLIFFISSSPPGCISSTTRSSSSSHQQDRTRTETVREITHTSSSTGPSTSRSVPLPYFINKKTTDIIINSVMNMYNNWCHEKQYEKYVPGNLQWYNAANQRRVMKNFIEETIRSVISDSRKKEDIVKITLVVYIASEYFYNLSLRDIWNRTEEETEELEAEHQKSESEIRESEEELQDETEEIETKNRESETKNQTPDEVVKQRFHDLIISYSEAVEIIKNGEINTKIELDKKIGVDFSKIMFNLADTIDKMTTFFDRILEKKINEYEQWGVLAKKEIRVILYRHIGEIVKGSFSTLRNYFKNSDDIRNIHSKYSYEAGIYFTPLTRTEPGTEVMPSISESEKSLWNTVSNISLSNDMNAIQILSECERRRYGGRIYIDIEKGHSTYVYPKFSLIIMEEDNTFYIKEKKTH